jgi:glyoxylase-like metal-dependent hydrolase (beta-lactamase superfamily II)
MTMELPVAEQWFEREDVGAGVTRLFERHVDPFLVSNVWHVRGRAADLVVDSANGIGPLRPAIAPLAGGRPVIAVATHGDFDHVGGLHEFEDRRVHAEDAAMTRSPYPMRLLRKDLPEDAEDMFRYYGFAVPEVLISAVPSAGFDVGSWVTPGAEPTGLLREGDAVDLGDRSFTVLHTPGHTAGSVCLFEEATGLLFSGDAIYVDDRLSWDDEGRFVASLRRLREVPATRVLAGHGRVFGGDELVAAIDAELARHEP